MKDYFIKIAITGLIFGLGYVSSAQKIVTEEEISFNILKWHFHHYPMSESKQWVELGEQLISASFEFEGKEIVAIYNTDGKRLNEEVDLTKEIPLSITYYLDDKYDKYKVNDFRKITSFSDELVYYKMDLKSKNRGEESLSFDEDLIPIDFALVSKAD